MKKFALFFTGFFIGCILVYLITIYYINNRTLNTQVKTEKQLSAIPADVIENSGKPDIFILKIAHCFPKSHPQHIALVEKFAPIIEESSNLNIRVEIYPNNQFGGEQEYIQGLINGTVEMCIAGEYLAEFLPGLKVLSLPYLFDSYDEAKYILDSNVGFLLADEMKPLEIQCLAWSQNGFRQIFTGEKDLAEIEEGHRLKIATSAYKQNGDTLRAMGFDALSVHMDEASTILKQKNVDGHDYPLLLSYYNGWYENQKYISITNHSISPAMYLISSKFWNSLPEKLKELVKTASGESAGYQMELLESAEKDILNIMEGKGIKVEYPDLSQYKKKTGEFYYEWFNDNAGLKGVYDEVLNQKALFERNKLKK